MADETQAERPMAERHEWKGSDGVLRAAVRNPRLPTTKAPTFAHHMGFTALGDLGWQPDGGEPAWVEELLCVVAERDEARARERELLALTGKQQEMLKRLEYSAGEEGSPCCPICAISPGASDAATGEQVHPAEHCELSALLSSPDAQAAAEEVEGLRADREIFRRACEQMSKERLDLRARVVALETGLCAAQDSLCRHLCMKHEVLATSHHPDCTDARDILAHPDAQKAEEPQGGHLTAEYEHERLLTRAENLAQSFQDWHEAAEMRGQCLLALRAAWATLKNSNDIAEISAARDQLDELLGTPPDAERISSPDAQKTAGELDGMRADVMRLREENGFMVLRIDELRAQRDRREKEIAAAIEVQRRLNARTDSLEADNKALRARVRELEAERLRDRSFVLEVEAPVFAVASTGLVDVSSLPGWSTFPVCPTRREAPGIQEAGRPAEGSAEDVADIVRCAQLHAALSRVGYGFLPGSPSLEDELRVRRWFLDLVIGGSTCAQALSVIYRDYRHAPV